MKNYHIILLIITIFLSACATKKQALKNNDSSTTVSSHFGQKPSDSIPEVLAPRVVSTAQSEPAVTLGEIASLQSKVLNKTIPLSIHLPANYNSSKKTYPVLYMLDSDYRARFAMLASTLDYMGEAQIPEMILIGVDLPEGNSILLPTRENQDMTIPDNYINFFETELMPHVENTYRTAPFNVLYGASNSGFFSVYTLLNNPLLFNSYLASSPSLMHIPAVLQQKIKSRPLKTLAENRFLHIIYSDDDSDATTGSIAEFSRVLADHKPERFTYKVDELVNQGHVPAMDFTQFLLALYPDFNPYENLDTLDKMTQHFDRLSKRYGYEILPPISMIFNLGVDRIIGKNLVVAEEIFQYSLQAHPESKESYLGMGVVRRNQRQFETAKALFEKALEIDPDYSLAKGLLQRLEKLERLYFGQKPPGVIPEVFAPGVVSINGRNESNISFSPDLEEAYFTVNKKEEAVAIYFSKLKDNKWTPAKRANFTNGRKKEELYPFVSFDNKRIYFTALDSIFSDEKIWYVNRLADSWSDAIQLDAPLNDDLVFYINQAENGDLFYTNISKRKMYYAQNKNGKFPEVQEVEIEFGHHGFIAPSQDYLLVYTQNKENEKREDADIYVCFKEKDGTWTKPINLGNEVNSNFHEGCPSITPDGKYLFFTRSDDEDELSNLYWVSTEVIHRLKPDNL